MDRGINMENVRSVKLQSGNQDIRGSAVMLKERIDTDNINSTSSGSVQQTVKEREIHTGTRKKVLYEAVKRTFDVIGSALGMIVLSPVFLLISIMILAERTGKKVIYKQRRLGKNGKEIYIYKFRSMVEDADNVEKWLNPKQLKQYYKEYKVDNDPRVTRFGKFLRRTGLDELPQIVNIFKGELSIVGPRPIQEDELEYYGDKKALFLSIRPGLTGYWQVHCSNGSSYTNGTRQEMELYYVRNRGLLMDIKLCFGTFGAILKKFKRGQ